MSVHPLGLPVRVTVPPNSQSPHGVNLLTNPVRRHIVDRLAALPDEVDAVTGERRRSGLSATELADELGMHVTTARFHLDQLVTGGLVVSWFQRRGTAGRPRKLYGVEAGSFDQVESRQHYELLSGLLLSSLTPSDNGATPTPEEVVERWAREHTAGHGAGTQEPARTAGAWLGRIGAMVDLLHEWGYTPDIATSNGGRTASVNLHDCPFLELANANPAVVCGIHRGLIKGAMEGLGESQTLVSLTPFVGPNLCVASLTTTASFDSPASRTSVPDKETHT